MKPMMITPDSSQSVTQRDPTEGSIPKKIQKGFIKYLHFPHEISRNRSRKYGVYCSNLDYERENHLDRSPSTIKRMKFIRSSKLGFPKIEIFEPGQVVAKRSRSVFNQQINKELKKLSRMFGYAKNLHSFTLYLETYNIKKEQGLDGISKKLKSLKNISSMKIQLPKCNINELEVEGLLKIITIQKKLSKLDIYYYGDSILKTGFIYLNKNLASCQNLSDLRVYLGHSSQNLPSMITKQFFSELSRLKELKALALIFPKAVNTDREFFESITECFKNLRKLKRLNVIFQRCDNIEDENLQIMAHQLSNFNELSYLSLNLGGCVKVNTAIEDISNSVQALKKVKTFNLRLNGCKKIDEKVLYSSINKISAQTSLTSLTLDFGEINIPDNFATLGSLNQLKYLDLSFNCRGSASGKLSSISKALNCLKDLESFRLYIYRSNESEKIAYDLADALTSTTKLKSLTLTFPEATFFTDNFCSYLKEPLSKLQGLEYLDLQFRGSQLTDQGIVKIASTLLLLRKLISLKLDFFDCQIKDKSLEAIVNSVLKMNQIRSLTLNLGQSLVTSQGILSIDRAISKLHDLENLELRFNSCENIEDNSVKRLCESLKELKRLQSLLVDFEGSTSNEFEKEVVDTLKNSLPFLKRFSFQATNIYPEVYDM